MPKVARRESFKLAPLASIESALAHARAQGFTHAALIVTEYAPPKPKRRQEPGTPGKIHLADARPGKVRSLPQ